jgi:hypothetical protein
MNFQSYLNYFESILDNPAPPPPYDNPDYFNYLKLNWSRTNRWLKHGVLSEEIKETITKIKTPSTWIIITEPWCGDAAHVVPFLHLIAQQNPLITVHYELRDSEPFRITNYLTHGGKSIPKLIVQSNSGEDLATWGPRPDRCQVIYDKLKSEHADFETIKIELQKWYNKDEGKELFKELASLLK